MHIHAACMKCIFFFSPTTTNVVLVQFANFAECIRWLLATGGCSPPLQPPPSQCICSFVLPPACQSHSCQPSPCVLKKSTQTEHANVRHSQYNVYNVKLLIFRPKAIIRIPCLTSVNWLCTRLRVQHCVLSYSPGISTLQKLLNKCCASLGVN